MQSKHITTTIITLYKIYQFTTHCLRCNMSGGNLHRGHIAQYIYMPIISTIGGNNCTIYIRVQPVRCKSKLIALPYFINIVLTAVTTFFTTCRFPLSGPLAILSPNTLTVLLDYRYQTERRKTEYFIYTSPLSPLRNRVFGDRVRFRRLPLRRLGLICFYHFLQPRTCHRCRRTCFYIYISYTNT